MSTKKTADPDELNDEIYWTVKIIPEKLSENRGDTEGGRNTSQLILWDQHYPDNKIRQRHYKKTSGQIC